MNPELRQAIERLCETATVVAEEIEKDGFVFAPKVLKETTAAVREAMKASGPDKHWSIQAHEEALKFAGDPNRCVTFDGSSF